jgi:4-coumarate--CoA ligase
VKSSGLFLVSSCIDSTREGGQILLISSIALLIRLVNDPEVNDYDLSCVKQFNTGAAPLASEIIVKLTAKYPTVALRQVWGTTESCGCITVSPRDMMTYANARTVGKPVPGTTLKVVDLETGRDLGIGEVGEVGIFFRLFESFFLSP